MSRVFRPWSPTQSFLLPPSPTDWLPEGHLVYFLLDLMPQLDLSAIDVKYEVKDGRGTPGFDPHMMTALLLYGYATGVASSRRLERATQEDVAFRVLTAGEQPDHSRISEFRREHLAELQGLFLQILRLCQKAGMVKLGHVALDGTKIQASASKHKAMSYSRMLKSEKELESAIQTWLAQTEQTDRAEDALHGKARGDELPEDLQHKQRRLERIRKAKEELEAEAAASRARELAARAKAAAEAAAATSAAEEARKKRVAEKVAEKAKSAKEKADKLARKNDQDPPDLTPRAPDELPSHQVKSTASGDPAPDAQRNFTDPESRIMKLGGDFVQGYNCQAAVDEGHQIIVAQALTNQAPDSEHLQALGKQMIANCRSRPWRFSADAGYFSLSNAEFCKANDLDAYISTGRPKHGEELSPLCGRIPKDLDARGRMERKLRTTKGKAAYARRKATVEPVFGQIKEARGFRRFLLRGLEKARGEWSLICATHNMLKLFGTFQPA
jgi:transposase